MTSANTDTIDRRAILSDIIFSIIKDYKEFFDTNHISIMQNRHEDLVNLLNGDKILDNHHLVLAEESLDRVDGIPARLQNWWDNYPLLYCHKRIREILVLLPSLGFMSKDWNLESEQKIISDGWLDLFHFIDIERAVVSKARPSLEEKISEEIAEKIKKNIDPDIIEAAYRDNAPALRQIRDYVDRRLSK